MILQVPLKKNNNFSMKNNKTNKTLIKIIRMINSQSNNWKKVLNNNHNLLLVKVNQNCFKTTAITINFYDILH